MSRSSSKSRAGIIAAIAALLLAGAPAGAQTPNPPGGGSGGGGTGCVPAGTAGSLLLDSGAGACTSNGSATASAGALSLGGGGIPGSLTMGNATSGTIMLEPVAGALGTVTASLPANSGTLAELNLAQSWPAIQTFTTPVLNGTVTGTGISQASSVATLAQRDANSNLFSNNSLQNAATTAGAGGITTLTSASARYQALTTAGQTYQLPNATTLSLGPWFVFNDNSPGALSITNTGAGAVFTVPAGGISQCGPTNIGSANGSWDCHSYLPSTVSWGTSGDIQVNNALSTTPGIATGASSSTSPAFKPQRGTANTGYSGDATHLYGVVGGTLVGTLSATGLNLPTGETYQINGSTIATTVNGQSCAIGGSCTVTAAASGVTVGTTTIGTGTTNGLLYDNAGVLGNLATANSGILVTSGAGVPSISTAIPNGVTATTQAFADNSTKIATTAYVQSNLADLGQPYFEVSRHTSAFTISAATIVQYNNTVVDSASSWDGTNFRYIPNKAGRWEFSTCDQFTGTTAAGNTASVGFYLNGVRVSSVASYITGVISGADFAQVCYSYYLTIVTPNSDYVDVRASSSATSPQIDFGTSTGEASWFEGHYVGPA